ncbi:MAG: GHKL domain-containing protein [Candidatus Gastranaerophilales bacterium]|nr:GHKL domain-containing protein [Candidatus Gastranaerophilales bacterium]
MKKLEDYRLKIEALDIRCTALLAEKGELELELQALKEEWGHVREQDQEIRKLHENVRRLKHDMKNHLLVIASCLNAEDYAAAREYTSGMLDQLNAIHSYVETGNSLMNHILNEKLELARSKGIAVKASIQMLSFAKMDSLDFSALLSNMLDNAIEACETVSSPLLQVEIGKRRGYEMIQIRNRIAAPVLAQNPTLRSSKPDGAAHGMGIPQIRSIVDKYQGLCDFYEEDGFFCACAFIPE